FALEVGRQAVSLAKHANRKTVSGEDIDLAVRTVWKA
ncbi:MAG: NFYB/HAP3 family transcription factor subunit, partial [Candidatus Korarchaeum sp.]